MSSILFPHEYTFCFSCTYAGDFTFLFWYFIRKIPILYNDVLPKAIVDFAKIKMPELEVKEYP